MKTWNEPTNYPEKNNRYYALEGLLYYEEYHVDLYQGLAEMVEKFKYVNMLVYVNYDGFVYDTIDCVEIPMDTIDENSKWYLLNMPWDKE